MPIKRTVSDDLFGVRWVGKEAIVTDLGGDEFKVSFKPAEIVRVKGKVDAKGRVAINKVWAGMVVGLDWLLGESYIIRLAPPGTRANREPAGSGAFRRIDAQGRIAIGVPIAWRRVEIALHHGKSMCKITILDDIDLSELD